MVKNMMQSPNHISDAVPFLSIIMPCYNEESTLPECLDTILANDYPHDRIEFLIIDGMSRDRTRAIIATYIQRYPFIRLIENPQQFIPQALNIGIRQAAGDILVRIDAHSRYDARYLRECVAALTEYGADNVGGRWIIVPRDNHLMGQAICHAISCSFGIGNAYYRLANADALTEPVWGEVSAYFCCRKAVFQTIGLFDEHILRSEDIDFMRRLKNAGLTTLLSPKIISYYAARSGYLTFVKHMFKNGQWVFLPLIYVSSIAFSLRHIVPFLFTSALLLGGSLAPWFPWVRIGMLGMLGVYGVVNMAVSLRIASRKKAWVHAAFLPVVFFSLHFSYGLGSLVGLCRLIQAKVVHRLRPWSRSRLEGKASPL